MESPVKLNRRHKVILFLTLAFAGTVLIFDGPLGEGAGVFLIGLALAWAFGSESRAVHWLFVASGLALTIVPMALGWNSHRNSVKRYESQVTEFERKIPELRKRYPLPPLPPPPKGSVPICSSDPLGGWRRVDAPSEANPGTPLPELPAGFKVDLPPKWCLKASASGANMAAVPSTETPGVPPEAFEVGVLGALTDGYLK